MKKIIFKEKFNETTLTDINLHNKKGWQIGNLTVLVPKNSKKCNRFRNILISELRVLPKGFYKKNKKSKQTPNPV